MNFTCCICAELFVPTDDVCFTPCGHFFHFPCVSHWLERSKSCPQCRAKVTERTIHRAYFNFSNNDTIESDSTVLQSKIESLDFQILLKNKDLQICGEDNVKLKTQAAGLREEVRKLELEIEKRRSAEFAYKQQLKICKQQSSDAEAAKKEIVRLTKKTEQFRNVETLISGSQDEVDEMLSKVQDQTSLATYICVMKREIASNVQKRKEFRTIIRRLEQDINKLKSERDNLVQQAAKCRQLEEDLAHSENEKKSLRSKLQELTRQLDSKRKTQSEDVHRFIAESPAPERLKTLRLSESISKVPDSIMMSPDMFESPGADNREDSPERCLDSKQKEDSPERCLDSKQKGNSPKQSPKLKSKETSPYLSLKSQGACSISALSHQSSRPKSSSSGLSILSKKPRIVPSKKSREENTDVHYDGFGGHSKVDNYPSPILRYKPKVIKNNLMSVKVKRRKLDTDDSKNKLDDYFIDLT